MWIEDRKDRGVVIEYCGTCRTPLFEHAGAVVMKVPGDAPSRLPLYLKCRNKNCGRKYKIHGVLDSDA